MASKSQESLDSLLSSISESIDSTALVVDKIEEDFSLDNERAQPELVKSLISTLEDTGSNPLDSVSLLSLKNSMLLGYVTDLALLLAIRLKSLKEDKQSTNYKEEVLKSTVTNRVILEKGIKSLEKKITYQLEKMINAYQRREKEQQDLEKKLNEKSDDESEESISGNEDEDEDDDDDDDEDEEEGLNFKPNPSALLKKSSIKTTKESVQQNTDEDEDEGKPSKSNEKYRPPKISASSINDPDKQVKSKKQRNLQSMDEYLQDISEAPTTEKSIGSTIINKGRDVKSKKQMEREADIQRYEEENFTRLPATKTKENKKDRAKRMRNEFFGEDWSMFENGRDINESGPKKRKRISAWERAKRKIDN